MCASSGWHGGVQASSVARHRFLEGECGSSEKTCEAVSEGFQTDAQAAAAAEARLHAGGEPAAEQAEFVEEAALAENAKAKLPALAAEMPAE